VGDSSTTENAFGTIHVGLPGADKIWIGNYQKYKTYGQDCRKWQYSCLPRI